MKTYLDCIPCFMEQALRASRISLDDVAEIKHVLDKVGELIKDIPMDSPPPEIAMQVYSLIYEKTGDRDPYSQQKQDHMEKALKLYPHMEEVLEESNDRILSAIKLAIAGNVIDLGVNKTFNIEEDILQSLHEDLTINDYQQFQKQVANSDSILYLGDNTGEAVFDKLLIEQFDIPVTFVVREEPILNDITKKEAQQIGIDEVAEIVSSGTTAPGNVLSTCTPEFRETLNKADMIISKGQGNYESLSDFDGPIYFLLKAKCPVIAQDIGIPEGGSVLMKGE